MSKFFKGLYTALITPFNNGSIDLESLEKIISEQLKAGVDGIVIAGSTGEVSTLEDHEYELILKEARQMIRGKTQMLAGISANTPLKAIKKARVAEENGVDGIMCVMPYYNKPPQRGLIEYFKSIHENTKTPIMLYSVPSRTGVDFTDSTILELTKLDRVRGLKDSANDIERPLRLISQVPNSFSLLSGEDANCVAYTAHGGVGCVSVISNIFPQECKDLQNYLLGSEFDKALALQSKLMSLYKAVFVETNPIPIKYAASLMGLCKNEVRSPLFPMEDKALMKQIEHEIQNIHQNIHQNVRK